jgi:hypothetical protein
VARQRPIMRLLMLSGPGDLFGVCDQHQRHEQA